MRQQDAQLLLSASEIVAAVQSLYADELKPFGRVLLKRLRERAAGRAARSQQLPEDAVDPETMPRVNPRHLQKLCESCRQLRVMAEEGREYSVTLVGRAQSFLDVCSPADLYPEEFWESLASYLDNLDPDELALPGGRYACARVLASRSLSFLEGYSLGQICHVVQLAISQRRLLGYRGGCLCPYKHSEGWVKEQCAVAQAPTGQESCLVVSWEEAPALLQQLLRSRRHVESGGVSISNLKRLFRLDFQRELSQTVLGYVRLLDLLVDPRLQEVCTLHALPNGQVLVRGKEVCPVAWCPPQWLPLGAALEPQWVPLGPMPMVTYFSAPEATKVPMPPPLHLSMPGVDADKGSNTDSTAGDVADCDLSSDASGLDSSSSPRLVTSAESVGDHWAINVKNTFIDVRGPRDTTEHRRRSLPVSMGASR